MFGGAEDSPVWSRVAKGTTEPEGGEDEGYMELVLGELESHNGADEDPVLSNIRAWEFTKELYLELSKRIDSSM